MSIKVRSSLHSLVIIAVLIFSAAGTTIAYADGGTTTDTPPTTSTDAAATATPAPTTDGSQQPNPHAKHKVKTAPATTDTANLNNVPQNTTVQVVNAAGQAQPLATQAAADAIATSDPIWCPQGQAPTPGANGCTQSFSSFTALLQFLAANATYQGNGTIYVQQGAYTGGEPSINFNNYNLSNISSAALTIQGGWNTSSNTVDPTATSTFNNNAIVIGSGTNPWGGTLTINNLSLNFTPTGSSGTGLSLTTQGDINIANVTVMNSATGAGAELNSTGGAVSIKNSHFDRNKTAGAIIRAKGDVAILNSSFSNPANGRRQATGVDITSDGAVSLLDVLADQTRDVGATIKAGGAVAISGSVNPFTGTPTSSFSNTKIIQGSTFLGYGLQVETPSDIAIANIVANNNFLWGASLHAGGNVAISDSMFNANSTASPGFMDDTGLIVNSGTATGGGTVSINHIQADQNRLMGATITATKDVFILNSFFDNNNGVLGSGSTQTFHGEGLRVVAGDAANNLIGTITLTGVSASNNTLDGAHLEANGDITVTDSIFDHNTTVNNAPAVSPTPLGKGLEIISGGNVFLSNVTATNNELNGVEVQGNCGFVFLTGGTYSNNGQYGLSITKMQLMQAGSPAPVFANNTAGNIFQDPGTCVFTAPTTPTTTGNGGSTTSTGTSGNTTGSTTSNTGTSGTTTTTSTVTSHQTSGNAANYAVLGSYIGTVSKSANVSGVAKVTLNSFLANSRLTSGFYVGLFFGKYVFVYTDAGMLIVAYYPGSANSVAMVGQH